MNKHCKILLFGLLFFNWISYAQESASLYFPIKSTEAIKSKKSSKAYNELEREYLNHELDTKKLPFFMTNYAHDTIWGYAKIKGPKLIQKKGVTITVNEMGELNHYTIKPNDVESLTIYYGKDSVKFRTIYFSEDVFKRINKGTIDKSYYNNEIAQHKRTDNTPPALLLVLNEGHIILLQYVINEDQSNSTYFIIYRNQLFIYSYEYFLSKGMITAEITEKEFYKIHPKFWVGLFNKHFSMYYQNK